ncbi:hypothetical protein GJAV_G00139980 [Gymnothorax javanicus]|nr:hypothetical protein GJAV_G00139980 [Gymnothorax javanicus]
MTMLWQKQFAWRGRVRQEGGGGTHRRHLWDLPVAGKGASGPRLALKKICITIRHHGRVLAAPWIRSLPPLFPLILARRTGSDAHKAAFLQMSHRWGLSQRSHSRRPR